MNAFLNLFYRTCSGCKCDSPLQWWAKNAHKYPLLAQVARAALAVPASFAPSERMFSQACLVNVLAGLPRDNQKA